MHRDSLDFTPIADLERGLGSRQFVAELHERGYTADAAADVVCQVFGVARGAARQYVDTHPAWSSKAPAEGPTRTRAFHSRRGTEPCWSEIS